MTITPVNFFSVPLFQEGGQDAYVVAEAILNQTLESFLEDDKKTPQAQIFKQNLRWKAEQIRAQLANMWLKGHSSEELRQAANDSILEINRIQEKLSLPVDSENTHAKILSLQCRIKNHTNTPENFNRSKTSEWNGELYLKDVIKGSVVEVVQHRYGTAASLGFEMLINIAEGDLSGESKSPARDLVISSASGMVVEKVLQAGLVVAGAEAVPAFLVAAGSHMLHDGAAVLKQSLTNFQENPENKESIEFYNRLAMTSLEGPTFEGSAGLAHMVLSTVQIPGAVLKEAQSVLTSTVEDIADRLETCQKNLPHILKTMEDRIRENHPEKILSYEGAVWPEG